MKLLLKLLRALKRIKFCSPPKNKIGVFDFRDHILYELILRDIQFSVIPADYGLLYVSFPVAFSFVKNFLRFYFRLKYHRKLLLLYSLSCLQNIKPKVVITVIDNNCLFHALSQFYSEAEFYAIQNAVRTVPYAGNPVPEIPRLRGIFNIYNFVCFGSYEVDLYRKLSYSVYKFHPVGALIGGYYWSQVRPIDLKNEFNICLVSQWRRDIIFGDLFPEDRRALCMLNSYLLKFINEREVSLCIAAISNSKEELEYFRSIFGDRVQIIANNRKQLSTYFAMDRSNVILTFNSTAAYEAFGWGKKVLFCNFSGNSDLDFQVSSLNSIDNSNESYEEFKNKVDRLIEIDDSEYSRMTLNARKYVMNYDFNMPGHNYIRKILLEQLNH